MSSKQAIHLVSTNLFGIQDTIEDFRNTKGCDNSP